MRFFLQTSVCKAMKCNKKENKETGYSYVGFGATDVGFGWSV